MSGEQKKTSHAHTRTAGLSSILLRSSGAQWIEDLFYLTPRTISLLYTCGGWGIEDGEEETGRKSGRINLRLQKTASNDS